MTSTWRKILWLIPTMLAIAAGLRGLSNWRTNPLEAESEQPADEVLAPRGIKAVRVAKDTNMDTWLLEAHSTVELQVRDVERLRSQLHFVAADFSKSDISDSAVRSLITHGDGPIALQLADTSVGDAAFDLPQFDREVHYLDLSGTRMTKPGLARIHRFKQWWLGYLSLARTNLGDEVIETFSERVFSKSTPQGYFAAPAVLNLAGTRITDRGVKSIRWNPRGLNLKDTAITDAALAGMRFDELVYLDLTNTAITDASLSVLAELQRLRVVRLVGTQVTDDGLKQFNIMCPRVCVLDRQPETVKPRNRVLDALGRGELWGRISDELWQDLQAAGKTNSGTFDVGVADNIEEGHVVLGGLFVHGTRIVATAGLYVPCW